MYDILRSHYDYEWYLLIHTNVNNKDIYFYIDASCDHTGFTDRSIGNIGIYTGTWQELWNLKFTTNFRILMLLENSYKPIIIENKNLLII